MQTSLQGKLKKTLPDEKCLYCDVNLQLRVTDTKAVSATRFVNEEIKVCPSCGETTKVKPSKRRAKVTHEEE